jgi:hypothetical protein
MARINSAWAETGASVARPAVLDVDAHSAGVGQHPTSAATSAGAEAALDVHGE